MAQIPFRKSPEKPSDLLARLKVRGMVVADDAVAYHLLNRIGYYRLTGYMLPFQTGHQPDPHQFFAGTTIEALRDLYAFDCALRTHIMLGVEAVELALRTALNNRLSLAYGPHWHWNAALYEAPAWPQLSQKIAEPLQFDPVTQKRDTKPKQGSPLFLDHYYAKYNPPSIPACWMLMEVASFGLVARLFGSLKLGSDRKMVAREFQYSDGTPIDEALLTGWVHSLSVLRNKCAHHSRVVHRTHPFLPKASNHEERP